MKFLWISLGGILGALLRYSLSGIAHKYLDPTFPWGTLCANLIGAFLIGLLSGLGEHTVIPPHIRLFLFIGLLGSFTTFSTYSLETLELLRHGETKLAAANVVVTNLVGLILVSLGFFLAKLWSGGKAL